MSTKELRSINIPITIGNIYTSVVNDGTLMYGAEYQRPVGVWKLKMKQDLIDSILRGFDLPKFYMEPVDDDGSIQIRFNILDGQQRIDTICSFLNNEFALSKDIESIDDVDLSNKKFKDLPTEFQKKIRDTRLSIVQLDNYNEHEIELLFLRLQSGVSLSQPEKRHAVRGDMCSLVSELKNNKIFDYCRWKKARYQDEDAMAKCLRLVISKKIVGVTWKPLMEMYKDNKKFDKESKSVKDLKKVFNFLYKGLSENKYYCKAKNPFISLVFAVWDLQREYVLPNDRAAEFIAVYISLDEKRLANNKLPEDERNHELYKYSMEIREEHSISMKFRHEIITKFLIKNMKLGKKDKCRQFTGEEKSIIYSKSGGKCCKCGDIINIEDFHADHIEPYVHGGKTILDNAQALCEPCNKSKGSKMENIIELTDEVVEIGKE